MPFLSRDDCDLYYEVHGSGPAIVFAHGLGGNHLSWWQQASYFRERYRCVLFAHRGFTPSTEASGGPGAAAFVDDLAALIAHLELPDVRLVAQSMGGWTCLGYTLRSPELVRALVLADTVGSLSDPAIDRHFQRDVSKEQELFARGIHPAAGERMACEQPGLHFLYQQIDRLNSALDKQALRAQLLALRTTPIDQVAALAVPILGIAGEEDVVIPPEAVAAMVALLPDARLALVPQAGHSVYFERPERFNQCVDEFFQSVGADH